MKIVIFNTAPLTFLGGFEGNIMDLGRSLAKTDKVEFVTGNQFINDVWTVLSQGHRCERRVTREYVRARIENLPLTEFGFLSLVPFSRTFLAARKKVQSSDLIYGKNEVFDIVIIKYWLLFCKNKPVIVCGVHTPITYPSTKTIISKLHNLVYAGWFYRLVTRDINIRFLTLNSSDAKNITDNLRINSKRIQILPNGVDTNKYSFILNKKNKNSEFSILFSGRLTTQKGIDTLVQAILLLSTEDFYSKLKFYISGTGEMKKDIDKILGRFPNVVYLGHVEKMNDLLNSVDIMVAPSRWEGFPLIVLEAQSCGLPVVGTNIPGTRDIVIQDKTGILIEPNDPGALKNSIIKMYQLWTGENEKFQLLRSQSRNNIEMNFSIESINKKIRNFFMSLISEKK